MGQKEDAWVMPDATSLDTRDGPNVLIADRASPAGAATFNTRFVDGAPIAGSRDERRP
jgi:hypothetical protein